MINSHYKKFVMANIISILRPELVLLTYWPVAVYLIQHMREWFHVLAAAGCTFGDVVDVTLFVVDPETNLDAIWSILPEYWGEAPYPTLTGIGVTWLYGFQFEVKVIARLP